MDEFLVFDHELTAEVNALPTLSQHIPSISVRVGATAIREYTGLPLLTDSQVEAALWSALAIQTLGLD